MVQWLIYQDRQAPSQSNPWNCNHAMIQFLIKYYVLFYARAPHTNSPHSGCEAVAKVSIITFPVSYNGSKAMLFCAHTEEKITPTKPFFMFLQFQKIFLYNVVGLQRTLPNEEGYFQDRLNYLKPKYVAIVQNATER